MSKGPQQDLRELPGKAATSLISYRHASPLIFMLKMAVTNEMFAIV